MTSVAQKRITLYATIYTIVVARVVKFYGFFMKCRRMRRTLVTPAAMAALPSLLSFPPCVFIVFLTRVKVKDCAKKPNELHGRGTKTQFQFQFRFQFGFRFSVSNFNFNL